MQNRPVVGELATFCGMKKGNRMLHGLICLHLSPAMHPHTCAHTPTHMCTYTYTHVHIHLHTHTCPTHTCTYTYTNVHIHLHTCTYKHLYIHIYCYTHARTLQRSRQSGMPLILHSWSLQFQEKWHTGSTLHQCRGQPTAPVGRGHLRSWVPLGLGKRAVITIYGPPSCAKFVHWTADFFVMEHYMYYKNFAGELHHSNQFLNLDRIIDTN